MQNYGFISARHPSFDKVFVENRSDGCSKDWSIRLDLIDTTKKPEVTHSVYLNPKLAQDIAVQLTSALEHDTFNA